MGPSRFQLLHDVARAAVLCRCADRLLRQSRAGVAGGRRQEAAKLLGWGRNALTRKIKELAPDL